MEYDPAEFMGDVEAALQAHSPHRRSRDESGFSAGGESIFESGEIVLEDYPASKRRRVSTNTDSTGLENFDISEWLTGGNEALVGEGQDEVGESDNENEDGDQDDVPAFFHPSLDMTTALVSSCPRIPPLSPSDNTHESLSHEPGSSTSLMSTERLDLVPNFYTYSVKACLLPIRKVQHALVSNYFHHIHPMFPVVDEFRMTELHQKFRGQEELMDPSDFTVYHAIMVVGFAHLSEAQVCNTPYRSVLEGQEAQVEQLKARYYSQPTADPVVLTQICLLLSLWSPGWIGSQNNSYWLDMAFKHATMGRLWEAKPGEMIKGRYCRRRLLWWCCLIRDRVLALGMRRPHRLHKTPIQDAIVCEEDFGLEATFPSYTDVKSKRIAMLAFIWFCRLSRIMEAIAIVQRRNRFARDWNGDNVGNTTAELDEVNRFDNDLRRWLEDFESTTSELMGLEKDHIPVPISTLRIIAHSLQAGLYQPYLHLSVDHPALVKAGIDPLERMKDGAREVAISVRDVMTNKKSDAIPTWLVAWVTLPVAVYHVNQRIRLNSSPDQVLMPFLAQLVRRSSGAQMLLMTVRSATKDHIEKIAKAEDALDPHTAAAPKGTEKFHFVHSSLSPNVITRSTEAKTLAFVTKAIDSALENNGNSPEES